MSWKDWSYARKGGICCLILLGILWLIITPSIQNCPFLSESPHTFCMIGLWVAVILYFPAQIILSSINFYYWPIYSSMLGRIAEFLVSLVVFALIGALIGWVVGKIKSSRGKSK